MHTAKTITTPHTKTGEEVLALLGTTTVGLTQLEAVERKATYGDNRLPEKKRAPHIVRFLKQFNNALVYILVIAAVISFVFERGVDAYVILFVIVVNAVIGFIQELRAEHAIEALRHLLEPTAKVMRDGALTKIPAHDIVPGDVFALEEGDRVPADARLIEEHDLRTLEASLTGESVPVEKDTQPVSPDAALADRANMVWMSTLVAGGSARAVVTATGGNTAIGQIAKDVTAIKEKKTHFRIRTDQLAWTMAAIAIASDLATLLVGFFIRHLPFIEIFLFSLASLVSGIPEGLPAVLTIVLAVGAYRMARRNAVVRHLPSTETLSVVTVIATDKTGTLTENSMTVRRIVLGSGETVEVTGQGWNPTGEFSMGGHSAVPLDHPALSRLLHLAFFGSAARLVRTKKGFDVVGDPTEAALTVLAKKSGLSEELLLNSAHLTDELPFERSRKYRARLFSHGTSNEAVTVGAFERILELSDQLLTADGKMETLTTKKRDALRLQGEGLANAALRVLGIAFRTIPKNQTEITHDDVAGLTFVGLVGMIDPPRAGVTEAIRMAKAAGIRIIMKTGDHAATAAAIAREVGIVKPDAEVKVLTEADLVNLPDDVFDERVRTHTVFARVSPETKLRIARSLQKQGEVVAVTGDGVNDAPALRQADIGIAMGRGGTDVAREASDIVLEDDNFSTIVKAIEEGRVVFRNTQQTSFYLVTTNVAEDVTILAALFLGLPLPLLPIHLLWMNLVTDGLTTGALATEPKHHGMLAEPPRRRNERILGKPVLPFLILMTVIMTLGTLFFFLRALPDGLERARTIAFAFMGFAQLWNVWNMRSLKHSLATIGLLTNRFVLLAFIIGALIQIAIIELPFLERIFQFTSLGVGDWLAVIMSSSLVLWLGELYKRMRYRDQRISPQTVY